MPKLRSFFDKKPERGTAPAVLHGSDAATASRDVQGETDMEEYTRSKALYANWVFTARKVAFEYSQDNSCWVLLSVSGTFWPYVLRTYELYLFPLLHAGLVIAQWYHMQEEDEEGEPPDQLIWGPKAAMVPFASLSMLTPLMIFALVFFLSQCYSRFMAFYYCCQQMETSIQDLTMLMLVHVSAPGDRWDAVRYLTAATLVLYARVTDLANIDKNGRRCKPRMDFIDWERLLLSERAWHGETNMNQGYWEEIMGWVDVAGGGDEQLLSSELHHSFGTKLGRKPRRSECPALLLSHEVDELRHYPDQMMTNVLLTWCAQTLKELEIKGELKGPTLGQSQGAVLKLRAAACKICNLLNLPIPLPYYHTLVMLQNICFAIFSYALLEFGSFFTPVMLFAVVLVTVGLREVAVALSNPFGKDDVDFPIDKWIALLRSNALMVHRDNRVVKKPARKSGQTPDDKTAGEDEEEEEVAEGAGADGGDDGDDGGE